MQARLCAQRARIARLEQEARADAAALIAAQREIERLQDERLQMQRRLNWRLADALHRVLTRVPWAGRMARLAVRAIRWAAGLRGRLRARAALRAQETLLSASGLFDTAQYGQDDPRAGPGAVRHYLLRGQFAGRTPHPLFDPAWYRATYPDVGQQEPLLHYLAHGIAEDRQPNAFFNPAWYRNQHPEVAQSGLDPLRHFIAMGPAARYDPSPSFQAGFYLDRYPDVAAGGLHPLAHYLMHGRFEGRTISASPEPRGPVERARIERRQTPRVKAGAEAALLVTHSPNGRLAPHVRHYLDALAAEGIAVTLIVAADHGFTEDAPWLDGLIDGLYVRDNEGWDFAAWAHVLRLNPGLYTASTLYWLNDSLIGPVTPAAFHATLTRVRASAAGMVGLTESAAPHHHLQSYFLAFKPAALRSAAFQRFVLGIRSLHTKEDVITAYELKLTACLEAAGITTAALFTPAGAGDPVAEGWAPLLAAGFPFLKVSVMTREAGGWREALAASGFDVGLADRVLAARTDPAPLAVGAGPHPALPDDTPRLLFVGPFNYGNGLGVAARGYLAALMHLRLPVNLLPVERPFHIHQRVTPTLPSTPYAGPADVALIHLNPEAWQALLTPDQSSAIAMARHRVGLFVWEALEIPPAFAAVTRQLSAVWVPSRYCAAAFRAVSEAPVHVVPYVVAAPQRPGAARVGRMRQDLGLAPGERVILFSFDASSYLARKNPLALVRAFDRSGLAGAGWRLVLKTKHLLAAEEEARALLAAVERSAGTILVNRPITAEAALSLLDTADIYASPHASEGFGLTIAEAMALGKPVIASDFGGSTDFLDASCGFPVRCTPWQLEADYGAYARGTTWGRIDEDALAATLTQAAALPAEAMAALGTAARTRIAERLSPGAVAARMRAGIDDVLAADR